MSHFNELLTSEGEELVKKFYVFIGMDEKNEKKKLGIVAKKLGIRPEQLIVAAGFNPEFRGTPELLPILAYESIDDLIKDRNELFIKDIYKKLSLNNILAVYNTVKSDPETLQVLQYLMAQRLQTIEERIEETVNSVIIEKYKTEIRTIYSDGIAGIDFAEKRLDKLDSGFRALLNEVFIITENKIIPAGEIFFRDTILPEEKRKLLVKGLIPDDLIKARLEDEQISQRERKLLNDYLNSTKHNKTGNA